MPRYGEMHNDNWLLSRIPHRTGSFPMLALRRLPLRVVVEQLAQTHVLTGVELMQRDINVTQEDVARAPVARRLHLRDLAYGSLCPHVGQVARRTLDLLNESDEQIVQANGVNELQTRPLIKLAPGDAAEQRDVLAAPRDERGSFGNHECHGVLSSQAFIHEDNSATGEVVVAYIFLY